MTAIPTHPRADRSTAGRDVTRTSTYGRQVSGILVAAFALSVGHTVYAWVEGIEDPGFTVTTPLAWVFYALAFGFAALARRSGRRSQVAVLAFLLVLLAIAVLYYPRTFGPAQQTAFGWFENDVYVGLLVTATWLSVQRLRRVTLRAE